MFYTALFIAIAALAFYAGYRLLHWAFPSWGTVMANLLAAIAMVLDYSAQIPWGTLLDNKEAAVIVFAGAAFGNIMARLTGNKTHVGSGA